MAEKIQLSLLTILNEWPTRKLPQNRFDDEVRKAMNGMTVFVRDFNENVPKLNGICDQVAEDGLVSAQNAENALASEKAAKASEDAARVMQAEITEAIDEAQTDIGETIADAKTDIGNAISTAKSNMDATIAGARFDMDVTIADAKTDITEKIIAADANMAGKIKNADAAMRVQVKAAEKSAKDAAASADVASNKAVDASASAGEAKAKADELYNLQINIEESPTVPGFAVLDRNKNTLTLRVPKGEKGDKGEPGPAGDITTAIESSFFQFVIEDGDLVLKYAGHEPATAFSINSDGYLEVEVV